VFRVNFVPSDVERSPAEVQVPFRYSQLKNGPREYNMRMVSAQDSMAWETQGVVTDRTQERLGVGDEGIILFRKMLKEQIENVQRGFEPIGMVRDPEKNQIIELHVINERIGLYRPQSIEQGRRAVAS
jgi:5,5'-dehydrodivanillate O-demethylase oxygenase subunit